MAGITDSQGNRLIDFHYEGYGESYYTSYDTEKAALLAQINPFGYRGYVLDLGTYMYYLQSRYYDPALGRFINADAFASTGQGFTGNNMFAYCGNNPVIRYDPSGCLYAVHADAIGGYSTDLLILYSFRSRNGPYSSPDEAAIAFSQDAAAITDTFCFEVATTIYSQTIDGVTTYDYITPYIDEPHRCMVNTKTPHGTTVVAFAHTHTRLGEAGFSQDDIGVGQLYQSTIYLLTPVLDVYRYNPDGCGKRLDPVTIQPMSRGMILYLTGNLRAKWNNHFYEKDKDCSCSPYDKWPFLN